MRTIQEKYNAILEGKFSKSQFVKDAKRELSQFLSPYNGYEDTVSILKSKGVIYEAKKSEVPEYDKPAPGYSIETLERAVDYELEGMGLMSQETVSEENYAKAKKKAEKNLEKDVNHYLHLLSGDSKKVDKHDKYVEVKKNNHVDTFNGLKKAELKEGVRSLKEEVVDLISFLKKERGADNQTIMDFIKMHFNDIRGASLDDVLDEFDNYISVNTDYVDEKKVNELEDVEDGRDIGEKIKEFSGGKNVDVHVVYHRYSSKMFYDIPVEKAIDITNKYIDQNDLTQADTGQKDYILMIDDGDASIDIKKADGKKWDSDEVMALVSEKKGKDHDGDGDIDGDDYMAAKDKAIKKAMGKKVNESSDYVSLAKQTFDGNPQVILTHEDPASVHSKKPMHGLSLKLALNYIRNNADAHAIENGDVYAEAGPDGVLRITIGDQEFDIKKAMGKKVNEADHNFKEGDKVSVFMRGTKANGPEEVTIVAMDPSGVAIVKNVEGQEDEVFIKDMQPVQQVNEGRRKKMKGGKVVTENDYETGGYVESMGPMLDKVLKQLIAVWDEWKEGPMTEPGMVPFAKKDLVSYIDSKISEGEDIVEDSIEENENIKEAFKAIITKVLQEEVITEAATGNLSKIATTYEDFEGMQAAINALENIVTDVESYYAKTKEKIQKVYDSFKDIKNAEGLAVGAMLGPAIEDAFRKDLMPVTEKGFTKGLEMPKVKMLETDEIAEEELEEKETVFKPINEALNKELRKFGPDLKKRLEAAGFKTGLFSGENMVPVEAQKKIQNDPSLAGIAYKKYPDGYEFLEVSVNKSKADELVKVAKYFSTPEGQYGPDKDAGWVVKNVRNVNPGDIYRSKLGGMNNLATIRYFRAEEAGSRIGTDKIKSTDKIAAEGKKYKYSKRK